MLSNQILQCTGTARPYVRLKLTFCTGSNKQWIYSAVYLGKNQFHTSSLRSYEEKKTQTTFLDRLKQIQKKIVPEEDYDKKPSNLEIKRKDLPANQPTLKERIKRDQWHMFFQEDEKHGYFTKKPLTIVEQMSKDLENPKKALTESFKNIKSEVAKFAEETKRGEYSIKENVHKAMVYEGQRNKEWGFQSELEMDEWILTKDSDWGEGYSSAEFQLNGAGSAGLLTGNLSTRVPNDGRTDNAGYVNIASVNQRMSFGRLKLLEHWQNYTHLTMNVRGDGRKYMINLKVKRDYDMTWDDRWHYPLFTRGGPYWQYVKIPFSKFYLGHKGFIQDRQEQPILCDMQSISITLQDKITGPFQLEIKDISLHNDPSGDDEEHAYEKYLVQDFWIGAG